MTILDYTMFGIGGVGIVLASYLAVGIVQQILSDVLNHLKKQR